MENISLTIALISLKLENEEKKKVKNRPNKIKRHKNEGTKISLEKNST